MNGTEILDLLRGIPLEGWLAIAGVFAFLVLLARFGKVAGMIVGGLLIVGVIALSAASSTSQAVATAQVANLALQQSRRGDGAVTFLALALGVALGIAGVLYLQNRKANKTQAPPNGLTIAGAGGDQLAQLTQLAQVMGLFNRQPQQQQVPPVVIINGMPTAGQWPQQQQQWEQIPEGAEDADWGAGWGYE